MNTAQPAQPPQPPLIDAGEFDRLREYLLEQSRRCIRAPRDRFEHPWLVPTPDIPLGGAAAPALVPDAASEAAIELCRHPDLRDAAAGSLLCLLDCAVPSGLVHRAESPARVREDEPATPVLAQFAARVVRAMGEGGPAWLDRHRVLERVVRFVEQTEAEGTGLHGLLLTHSSRQSGFESDLLTASLPDRTVEGPDTNAFMVREHRALAEMARALGRRGDAERHEGRAARLCALMERLLYCEDDRGGFYGALQWRHGAAGPEEEWVALPDSAGRLRAGQSWLTLLPLYAGVPSPERARKVVQRLLDERAYWGPAGVRSLPRDDPFFHQASRAVVYDRRRQDRAVVANWSGPVRTLSSYYMCKGLMRYGYLAQARELALRTARLLARDLETTGRLHESYCDEGRGLWPLAPATTFIGWNVLALTMLRQLVPEVARRWAEDPEKV